MGKLRYRGVMFIGCVGFLVLGACGREGQDEMSWARGALATTGTELSLIHI